MCQLVQGGPNGQCPAGNPRLPKFEPLEKLERTGSEVNEVQNKKRILKTRGRGLDIPQGEVLEALGLDADLLPIHAKLRRDIGPSGAAAFVEDFAEVTKNPPKRRCGGAF